MNDIVLIRHGETDMAGKFCGHSDPELNPVGMNQVIRLAEDVATLRIERIYSSDLRRASQTAEVIAQCIGISVDYLPPLREICFGQWEGLHWREIEDRFPNEAARWLREFPFYSAPGGEAYMDFTTRIDSVIAPILEAAELNTTAIVSHRGVISYALTRFFGFSREEAWTKTALYCATIVIPASKYNHEVSL